MSVKNKAEGYLSGGIPRAGELLRVCLRRRSQMGRLLHELRVRLRQSLGVLSLPRQPHRQHLKTTLNETERKVSHPAEDN